MASKLVLLCGYYGYGNGGDEALLATLIQMLPADVTPVVMSATPAKTAIQHQVATCNRSSLRQVLPLMFKAKGFIWGGGSLIQDSTSWLSPLFYLTWMTLAQFLRLKTIAWAQGIGPLNRGFIQAIAYHSFKGCTARSTRDTGSAALLDQWGLHYELAPDPVWALNGTSLSASKTSSTSKRVAIVLRRHPLLTATRLEVLTQALIQFQTQTQTQLLLLPFQRSQDYDIAAKLQDQLPDDSSELLMLEDPRQLKGVFQSVEMTIAMRLHALIMAAAEGCRCFALSYDPKVSQLMADLALPGVELSKLPSQIRPIATRWQEILEAPTAFDETVIRDRIQRSQAHQTLLQTVFQSIQPPGFSQQTD
jgi:polysaccharide pyruvyl transferase CsaB